MLLHSVRVLVPATLTGTAIGARASFSPPAHLPSRSHACAKPSAWCTGTACGSIWAPLSGKPRKCTECLEPRKRLTPPTPSRKRRRGRGPGHRTPQECPLCPHTEESDGLTLTFCGWVGGSGGKRAPRGKGWGLQKLKSARCLPFRVVEEVSGVSLCRWAAVQPRLLRPLRARALARLRRPAEAKAPQVPPSPQQQRLQGASPSRPVASAQAHAAPPSPCPRQTVGSLLPLQATRRAVAAPPPTSPGAALWAGCEAPHTRIAPQPCRPSMSHPDLPHPTGSRLSSTKPVGRLRRKSS